jgi:hypothetical protein
MKSKIRDFCIGYTVKGWLTIIWLLIFLSGSHVFGQAQFQKSLEENQHLLYGNLGGIGCTSKVNPQPHDRDTALSVSCTIEFIDGTPEWSANLRFCSNFETCDAAGGKFKDMIIAILRKKTTTQLAKK